MGFTSERLEHALKVLRERGHVIAKYPDPAGLAVVGKDGLMVAIDSQLRTTDEIYAMAENLPEQTIHDR